MNIKQIPTSELVHDYLESYMDIARLELAMYYREYSHASVVNRLAVNKKIANKIVEELARRDDKSLFDRRELILGEFST